MFHRVIAGVVVKSGGYTIGILKRAGAVGPIELESDKGLSNLRCTLSMARINGPNSAMSEFFINLVDYLVLDYKNGANLVYRAFGKVVKGMEVVDAIAAQSTGILSGFADVPLLDIAITMEMQTKYFTDRIQGKAACLLLKL